MSKTKALRGVIMGILSETAGGNYHRNAPDNAPYPYKVYTLQRVDLPDLARDDYDLQVDIWDRGPDPSTVEEITDQLSDLFNANNAPTDEVLPTFFRDSLYPVEEPDKELIHYQMHFIVQNYVR